jgi:hypothetical protein
MEVAAQALTDSNSGRRRFQGRIIRSALDSLTRVCAFGRRGFTVYIQLLLLPVILFSHFQCQLATPC